MISLRAHLGLTLWVALSLTAPSPAQEPVVEHLQTLFNGSGLAGVRALVASSDGRHVYAAGNTDRALVAFARSDGNGRLIHIETYHEGISGVSAIEQASRLVLSADGALLWAVGGGAVVTFARDPESGSLRFIEALRDFGITQPLDVAPSADGRSLYVVGSSAVALLAIESDGTLTSLDTLTDGSEVDSLAGAQAVAAGTQGRFVYVASAFDQAITVLRHQGDQLSVSQVASAATDTAEAFGELTDLSIASDGRTLYATVRNASSLSVFAVNQTNGEITSRQVVRDEDTGGALLGGERLVGSPDGTRLYVTSRIASSVAQFEPSPANGELTFLTAAFANRDGVVGMSGSADVALGPGQTHVYVAGSSDGSIALFDAALTFMAVERNSAGAIAGLRQPTGVATSPDGRFIYTAGFGDGAVSIFRRIEDGTLAFDSVYRGPPGDRLLQPIALAMAADGAAVATADFGDESVQLLSRNPADGTLQPGSRVGSDDGISDLRGVAAVTFVADQSALAATSVLSDAVILFDLPQPSELRFRATMPALNQPSAIEWSPDGRHLYTTSSGDNAVLTFERVEDNPSFPQTQVLQEGENGISGLSGAASVALSPDGDHLYVASGGGVFQLSGSDAVVTFARNATNGMLTYVDTIAADDLDDSALLGATAVAVSPDGTLVAVAGFTGDSLTLFHRSADGELTLAQVLSGETGVDGLAGASALTFSPDGGELYVTAFADDTVSTFAIIPTTPPCAGDCDDSGTTQIPELIRCVNFALSGEAPDICPACDTDTDGSVAINDLIRAVNAALDGCPTG